jgi:hypothetical protein
MGEKLTIEQMALLSVPTFGLIPNLPHQSTLHCTIRRRVMTLATRTQVNAQTKLEALYITLAGRARPEAVVSDILALHGRSLRRGERVLLNQALREGNSYSLMPDTFHAPQALHQTTTALAEILGLPVLSVEQAADPVAVRALLALARPSVGMVEGQTDFRFDRMTHDARKEAFPELSRHRYNKLFRIIGRLEQLVCVLEREWTFARMAQIAKTSFATNVPWEAFAADRWSASFVAYMASNLGRRSLFTNSVQPRAFDEVAAMLLARCEESSSANWFAIAHVFPRHDVLARLTDEQRMDLLVLSLGTLREASSWLRWAWERVSANPETMTVRSGDDSSTWNALAGAFNKARDYWIALIESLGQMAVFDELMPGKVLRLIAADVVAWHRLPGDDKPHGDTFVWAALPKPWDVLIGDATCTYADIEAVCACYDVAPASWTRARERVAVAPWVPTPELVHGVVVKHPELAALFRKIGVFSGKSIKIHRVYDAVAS